MKWFIKKKNGVSNIVICIITLVSFSLLLAFSMSQYKTLDLSIEKEALGRAYILKMESDGYLTSANKVALENELAAMGVDNLNFTGTTLNPVTYGQSVILSVTGTLHMNRISGVSGTLSFLRGTTYEFKIYLKSTAKY